MELSTVIPLAGAAILAGPMVWEKIKPLLPKASPNSPTQDPRACTLSEKTFGIRHFLSELRGEERSLGLEACDTIDDLLSKGGQDV